MVDVLLLERGEEGLHRRVIQAVPFAAHRLLDAVPFQHLAVGLGGVLDPAVAVVDQPGPRVAGAAGPSPGRPRTARTAGDPPSTGRRPRAWPGPRSRRGGASLPRSGCG